jgi:hypothetical protein
VEASKDGVASIDNAGVVRRATDVGVNTTNAGIATVDGTNVVIVTVSGIEGDVDATSKGVALINVAMVAIVTNSEVVIT